MADHSNVNGPDVHTPYRQIFADAAARAADPTVYTAADINKKALQVDNGAEFRLASIGPTVWSAVGDGAGGDMETTYGLGGAITTLDVAGGNDLLWDSAVPDALGLGLFGIRRNEGAGEATLLKAPQQPDDVTNEGTPLFLIVGGGSNQATGGTGLAGTGAGGATIGGPPGIFGGVGSEASGAGTPGGAGGNGGQFSVFAAGGGAGGAGSGADAGGAGGSAGSTIMGGGAGGVGGAAGATGPAGAGGLGSSFDITAAAGGAGGDGTAAGAAGDGASSGSLTIAAGEGGAAGADGGGGGANGGSGQFLRLLGGGGGAKSGAGADGVGGDTTLDAGSSPTTSLNGTVSIGGSNATSVSIGKASTPVPMVGIPQMPSFTVATLPSVATFVRGLIFVSDETGGAVPAYSDGTNWRRFSDGVIVS